MKCKVLYDVSDETVESVIDEIRSGGTGRVSCRYISSGDKYIRFKWSDTIKSVRLLIANNCLSVRHVSGDGSVRRELHILK